MAQLKGGTYVGGDLIVASTLYANTMVSSVSTGTAPLTVASTTMVANLNADLLDGQHGSYYAPASGSNSYIQNQNASAQSANAWINGQLRLTAGAYGSTYNSVFGTRGSADGILQLGNNNVNYIVGGNTAVGGFLEFWVNASSDFVTSNNGTKAMTIASNGQATLTGRLSINSGDDSGTMYGPNASWANYLYVGASGSRASANTAQVINTAGNLHLDSGTGGIMYLNYYSNTRPIHAYGSIEMNGHNIAGATTITSAGYVYGADIFSTNWLRNGSTNTGIYNNANTNHLYSRNGSTWAMSGDGSTTQFQLRLGHEGTLRGALYGDGSNFGILNNQGSWVMYTPANTTNAYFQGSISATNLSGTNTGDQVNISGNAASATKVSATIAGGSFDNLVIATMGDNDYFRIGVGGAANAGYAEISTGDDGTEPIYVRQYTGFFSSLTRSATLLDGSGNTSFPGILSAVSLKLGTGGISDNNYTRITNPGGGVYVTSAGTIVGAIKIRFPMIGSGMMTTMSVKIYEYSTGQSFELTFGGHRDGTSWYNVFAYQLGENKADINVRFGDDGSYNCVWIGEVGSSWSYPQVFITDVNVGYAGYSAAFERGWGITFETSLGTIIHTRVAYRKIDGSNIGSQSVNYATTAGTASYVNITYNNTNNATYQMLWGTSTSILGTGGVYINPSISYIYATNFQLTSDVRYKENIKPISLGGVDVEYKEFNMIANPSQQRYGVLAQDLLLIRPELVDYDEEHGYSVNYIDLHTIEINALKKRVEQLEKIIYG